MASDPQTTLPPVDPESLGRRLRSARVLAGYDRMTDFASALEDECGVSISSRTLYAFERGEQMPSFSQMVCLVAMLSSTEASSWSLFEPAIRDDLRERMRSGRD